MILGGRKRRIVAVLLAGLALLPFVDFVSVPNQDAFIPLASLIEKREPFVRLYAARIPYIKRVAVHTWFVTYDPEREQPERWEIWQAPGWNDTSWDHMHCNLWYPESGVGAGRALVIAELTGSSSVPIVEFIRTHSPSYPLRHTYCALGPNSNTYPQWVLDNTGWDVELPFAAIGKNYDWKGTAPAGRLGHASSKSEYRNPKQTPSPKSQP